MRKIRVQALRTETITHIAELEIEVPDDTGSNELWDAARLEMDRLPKDADRWWGERVPEEIHVHVSDPIIGPWKINFMATKP